MDYKERVKEIVINELYKEIRTTIRNIIPIDKLDKEINYCNYRVYYYDFKQILSTDINIENINIEEYLILNDEIFEIYYTKETSTKFYIVWKNVERDGIAYLYKFFGDDVVYHVFEKLDEFNDNYIRDYTNENFELIDGL